MCHPDGSVRKSRTRANRQTVWSAQSLVMRLVASMADAIGENEEKSKANKKRPRIDPRAFGAIVKIGKLCVKRLDALRKSAQPTTDRYPS